MIDLDKII